MGIREACLFLTNLLPEERKSLYDFLEKSKIKKIPFVHLRSDMELWELDYFVKNYSTEVFNIHTEKSYPLLYNLSKYKDIIYVENIRSFCEEEELKNWAGICLDFTHLENDRISNKKRYDAIATALEKHKIGCNHISSIKNKPTFDNDSKQQRYDKHLLENLSELDYLKNYPAHYFSRFLAIELENSIKEQLEAKNYIIEILKDKE